jgi:uncharacterized integral membrane protein
MSKIKAFWLLFFGAVLAIFMVQNWYYPDPPIHFLGFQFLPFPMPIIILGFFLLGFLAGWLIHAFGTKGHKPEGPLESMPES